MKAIAAKLLLVRAECAYLQKDQRHGVGYKFVGAPTVARAVGAALNRHKLAIVGTQMQTVREAASGASATVLVTVTLCDIDSGETCEFQGLAGGADGGDKAVSKAVTMANKYLWITALCIETGESEVTEHDAKMATQQFKERAPEAADLAALVTLWFQYEKTIKTGGAALEKKAKGEAVDIAVARFKVTADDFRAEYKSQREEMDAAESGS